jgi:ferritin-like metal-binding protein YciE
MAIQSLKDLFVYDLSAVYDLEQTLTQMVPQIVQEITIGQAQSLLQQHDQETQRQIQNLDRCFQLLGIQRQPVRCYVLQGFSQEHDAFRQQTPSPAMLSLFDLGMQEKIERYESMTYQGLIEKANLLGQAECVRLLEENKHDEDAEALQIHQIIQQTVQTMGQAQRRAQ